MEVTSSRLGDELYSEGADNGSSMAFLMDDHDEIIRSDVDFIHRADPSGLAHMALVRKLRLSTGLAGLVLLDFQIQAIANTVYRPSLIKINKTIVRKTSRGGDKTFSLSEKVRFGSSDIGVTVVNDLMPGSGKSLVTMVSTIFFAMHRAKDVVNREEILLREQRPMNWSSRFDVDDFERSYTNSIIVMTSDKVVAQWEHATKQACEILNVSQVSISRNPTKEFLQCNSENLTVNFFTSVAKLRLCFPHDTGFVPCVVVDEYVVKATHNIATRNAEATPLYGRMVLVSADAGNTSDIVLGSRRTSLIRATVANREVDVTSLKNDVKLSAALMACGVLPTTERNHAHDFLILGFNEIPVEKYYIKYNSPVWGGMDGIDHIMPQALEELGIKDLASVQSVEELQERVKDAMLENPDELGINQLDRLHQAINQFLEEDNDCAVCMDKLKSKNQVCMICPCWHFFCKNCTKQCLHARDTCASCRQVVDGVMEVRPSEPTGSTVKDILNNCNKFQDFVNLYLPNNPGALEACSAIINASAGALLAEIDNPILKLLVVGPAVGFSDRLCRSIEGKYKGLVEIVQLQVEGNKRKRTSMGYEQQLEWFNRKEQGGTIKVLCTHENGNFTDDLYGLDLHGVDAICHVGRGVDGRRLGRVARVQRALEKSKNTFRIFNLVTS